MTKMQLMAELPQICLVPKTWPFFNIACDYFGPYNVKIGRNCRGFINNKVHATPLHVLCTKRLPICDKWQWITNGRHRKRVARDNQRSGQQSTSRVLQWERYQVDFQNPAAPYRNRWAESLVNSCKSGLKKVIGEQVLTPFELYTYLLEVANLVKQCPIGRIPKGPDDAAYLCLNDMLFGRTTAEVTQGPFQHTKIPHTELHLSKKLSTLSGSVGAEMYFPH